MLDIRRSGPTARGIALGLRTLVDVEQPLILAKSLTFTVQRAQAAIVSEMPKVFAGGATRYTLGATRIEPASVDNLTARVAVKDQASSGTLPEDYLFPSVFGGARKEKRFERALRYGGLLRSNERAMLGDDAPLDEQGNYKVAALRTLLNTVAGLKRGERPKGKRSPGEGRVRRDLFVGTPNWRGALPGVYQRTGKDGRGPLKALLVFVSKAPTYRSRLDFEGIARATTEREFPAIFDRLLRKAAGIN